MIQNYFMVTKEGNEGKQLVRRKMKLFFCLLKMLGMIIASKEGKLSLPTIVFLIMGIHLNGEAFIPTYCKANTLHQLNTREAQACDLWFIV